MRRAGTSHEGRCRLLGMETELVFFVTPAEREAYRRVGSCSPRGFDRVIRVERQFASLHGPGLRWWHDKPYD